MVCRLVLIGQRACYCVICQLHTCVDDDLRTLQLYPLEDLFDGFLSLGLVSFLPVIVIISRPLAKELLLTFGQRMINFVLITLLFTAVAVVGVSAIRQLDLAKIQGIICQEGAL